MKVYEDIDAQEFRDRAWSGAVDTLEDLTDDQIETIFQYLEETEGEEGMSLTSLNDFFWFERDTIADWLGYSDYEQLMQRGDKGNDYYDDMTHAVRISHGSQGVGDFDEIEGDLLYSAKEESDGEYEVYADSEEIPDDDSPFTGYVEANVSDAIIDWLDENGVDYEEL